MSAVCWTPDELKPAVPGELSTWQTDRQTDRQLYSYIDMIFTHRWFFHCTFMVFNLISFKPQKV